MDDLGSITQEQTAIEAHIKAVLAHPLVQVEAIQNVGFSVVLDGINSTGG